MRVALWTATVAASLFFSSLAHGQWTDLGHGLSGTTTPTFTGLGSLEPITGTKLEVNHALPLTTGTLIIGFSNLSANFKGGVLVPSPNLVLPFPVNPFGTWFDVISWPAGVPTGFQIYWQAWLPDAGAPAGFSATNAVRSTAP